MRATDTLQWDALFVRDNADIIQIHRPA
jgi:hypothetical protein